MCIHALLILDIAAQEGVMTWDNERVMTTTKPSGKH